MSQNRDVSIPLKDEVRSVESSTMGDDTREFLVEDSEPVDSITGLTEDSLDILKPLVTTSVPPYSQQSQNVNVLKKVTQPVEFIKKNMRESIPTKKTQHQRIQRIYRKPSP